MIDPKSSRQDFAPRVSQPSVEQRRQRLAQLLVS
jgi:hypothetical protein